MPKSSMICVMIFVCHAFVLFGTVRFYRWESFIKDFHVLKSIEVESIKHLFKMIGFIIKFHFKCIIVSLFDLFFVDVKCQEVDFYWSWNRFIDNVSWFEFSYPWMTENLLYSSKTTKSSGWIFYKQALEQHFYLIRQLDMRRKIDFFILNRIIYFLHISGIKRRVSRN